VESEEQGAQSGGRGAESTERKRGGTERKLRQNRAETEAEIKAETGKQILKTQSGLLSILKKNLQKSVVQCYLSGQPRQ